MTTGDLTTGKAPAASHGRGLPRIRALDGLRGLAVAAVLLYHLGFSWMPGGFLGVSLFFTLSGFLITSLLLVEQERSGTIALRHFWSRRFRRLLPAAWAGIALAVMFTAVAGDPDQLRALPGDVLGAIADVANWRFLLAGSPYLSGYQQPSPLLHFWSLAIEEQFYLLFPLVVAGLVARRITRRGWWLAMGLALAGSMILTLVLYDPDDTSRVYFNTGSRIAEILAGVLLALTLRGWWTQPQPSRLGHFFARFVVPIASIVTVLGLWWRVSTADLWLYRGGLWLVAGLSCLLVVATLVDGPVARVLALEPFVGLGVISYGVYVYHWPVFLWLSPERTGLGLLPLAAVRLLITFGLALASYRWFEMPIRQGHVRLTPAVAVAVAVSFVVLVGAGFTVGRRADERAVTAASDAATAAPIVTQPPISSPIGTAPGGGTPGSRPRVPAPNEVLFLGDSLLHQAYPVIADHFGKHDIPTRAIGGPGQSLLGHDARWLDDLTAALAEDDPDVVVIETCCGHGDRNDPFHVDGVALDLDTDALWRAWEDAADQAVELAQRDGRLVLWVLAPPAKTNGYYGPIEGRITRANQIAIDVAARHPGMGFVDWRVISAPDGSFTESLRNADGELVTVRAFDGLHFTPAGMQVLADLTRTTVEDSWQATGGRTRTTRGSTPGTTPRRAPGTTPRTPAGGTRGTTPRTTAG